MRKKKNCGCSIGNVASFMGGYSLYMIMNTSAQLKFFPLGIDHIGRKKVMKVTWDGDELSTHFSSILGPYLMHKTIRKLSRI